MRARSFPFFTVLLALLFAGAAGAAHGSDFDDANQLYDTGKFAQARTAFQQLVNRGEWSANLFYNLGNADFRLDALGAAMLDYQRALALEPSHPEARANLNLIRSKTGSVPWPASWFDALFPGRVVDAYLVVAVAAGWIAFALIVWIAMTPAGEKAGRWFALVVTVLVAAYGGVAVWHFEKARSLAIVIAKAAEVRLAPADTAAAAGVLSAGSEVRVLSVRGDWTYCDLPEQRRGWLSSRDLERVRLGGS